MTVEIEEINSEALSGSELSATEEYRGTRVTIAPSGDYSIDTREAETGGDTFLRLKAGGTLKVEIGDSLALRVEDLGGWLRIELGPDADQRLVLGDKLVELLNRFFTNAFDMHVHPTPMGPSGPPLPPFVGGRIDESVLSKVTFTK